MLFHPCWPRFWPNASPVRTFDSLVNLVGKFGGQTAKPLRNLPAVVSPPELIRAVGALVATLARLVVRQVSHDPVFVRFAVGLRALAAVLLTVHLDSPLLLPMCHLAHVEDVKEVPLPALRQ